MKSIKASASGAVLACALAAALPVMAAEPVLKVRPDRVLLQDLTRCGARMVAVGERGLVLLSDDGGNTWQTRFTPVTRTLSGVAFANARQGVAVGHGGTVLVTDDGGANWKAVKVDAAGTDSLLGVTHLGRGTYVAYGAFGLYIESLDDGATWVRKQPLGADFDRHISQVAVAGDHLFLVGESGTLARSADRGQHWEKLTSPYQGSFFGALAGRDGALLIYGMRGNVFRSANDGSSWSKVDTGTTLAMMNGRRLDDGRIVLVGNAGLVALSTDNGNSFRLQKTARGKGLAQIGVSGKGELLAVGEAGVEQVTLARRSQ
jgi:photosystem II stability/assembly factor-like uncharacterized protein